MQAVIKYRGAQNWCLHACPNWNAVNINSVSCLCSNGVLKINKIQVNCKLQVLLPGITRETYFQYEVSESSPQKLHLEWHSKFMTTSLLMWIFTCGREMQSVSGWRPELRNLKPWAPQSNRFPSGLFRTGKGHFTVQWIRWWIEWDLAVLGWGRNQGSGLWPCGFGQPKLKPGKVQLALLR